VADSLPRFVVRNFAVVCGNVPSIDDPDSGPIHVSGNHPGRCAIERGLSETKGGQERIIQGAEPSNEDVFPHPSSHVETKGRTLKSERVSDESLTAFYDDALSRSVPAANFHFAFKDGDLITRVSFHVIYCDKSKFSRKVKRLYCHCCPCDGGGH